MKVLLIDDLRTIERATYTARTYKQGIAALQRERWDVLLLDHDLGGKKSGLCGLSSIQNTYLIQ